MKSKRQIYLVFDCDTWKDRDSMRLCLATTSTRRLKSFVSDRIEHEDFVYCGSENMSAKKAAKRFREDFDALPCQDLNDHLDYGFIDYAYDGEEI